MCELFGASASRARRFADWLIPFRERGGASADNPDGWGIAHWRVAGPVIEKSPEPGWRSVRFAELARTVESHLVLAHVRRATHPPVPRLLNTHPFAHHCCGRQWVFAHNGMVPETPGQPGLPCVDAICQPDGETDSELAFCQLLAGIAGAYAAEQPCHWLGRLAGLAAAIARRGEFNFLLSDGRILIAYGHDRLHWLESPEGVILVATAPLGEGDWQAFAPGELRVYRDGALLGCSTAARAGAP